MTAKEILLKNELGEVSREKDKFKGKMWNNRSIA